MRISDQRWIVQTPALDRTTRPAQTTAASTTATAAPDAAAAATSSGMDSGDASQSGGFMDAVRALVDRLAVQTQALSAAAGPATTASASGSPPVDADDSSPGDDPTVLSLMQSVFGVGPVSDLKMSFDYAHDAGAGASASATGGAPDGSEPASSSASAYAYDATGFSAKGTFTGADGHDYAFTVDYESVTAAVGSNDDSSSDAVDGAATQQPLASTDAAADADPAATPAWNLASLIDTISTPSADPQTFIARLRAMLGLDQATPPADATSSGDDARSAQDAASAAAVGQGVSLTA